MDDDKFKKEESATVGELSLDGHQFKQEELKQTSVSHSSTESEIISLDAGFRMDGVPVLDLWDAVIEVLHSSSNNTRRAKGAPGHHLRISSVRLRREGNRRVAQLSNPDHVTTNANSTQCEAQLYIFEDDEAVIKGRSPMMRHVIRTHRVALDWLFDRVNLDPKIQIKYVDTKKPTRRHVDPRELDS